MISLNKKKKKKNPFNVFFFNFPINRENLFKIRFGKES